MRTRYLSASKRCRESYEGFGWFHVGRKRHLRPGGQRDRLACPGSWVKQIQSKFVCLCRKSIVDTKWQSVKDHMRRAGNVDQANMLEGPDGRSKGCAIVVYQHPKDAVRAIKTLQDTELDGRKIFVTE
eukprot:575795_1